MTKTDINKFITDIKSAVTPQQVDEAFAKIPSAARKAVADALEDSLVNDFVGKLRGGVQMLGPQKIIDSFKETFSFIYNGKVFYGNEAIQASATLACVIENIDEIKGKLPAPLDAFNAVAKSLTLEEHTNHDCFLKPVAALINTLANTKGPVERAVSGIRSKLRL